MAYDIQLADRIRAYLNELPDLDIEEKEMFRGLTFMVNGKMCVSVSGDEMMVRFDPALHEQLAEENGFRSMQMKSREYKGYGYISPEFIRTNARFDYWMKLCLDFNPKAKASKKR